MPSAHDYANVIASTKLHIFDNTRVALTRALTRVTTPQPLTLLQLADIRNTSDTNSDDSDDADAEQNDFFTKVYLPYFDDEHETTNENTYQLREWLCRNYLLPHPTRADKTALATNNDMEMRQVTDWFTNMRSRVWKPSIEQLMDELLVDKHAIEEAMKIRVKSKGKEASTSA